MEKEELNDDALNQRPLPEKKDDKSASVAGKPRDHLNSIGESIAHMTNACLGGGVFAMHVAFSKIGVSFAIIGLIIIAILVGSSMCALVSFAQKIYSRSTGQVTRLSYPELAEASVLSRRQQHKKLAKCFRFTVDFILSVHLLGSCLIYQVFLAQNLKELLQDSKEGFAAMTTSPLLKIYVVAILVPCVLIAMVTDLKHLAPFAIIHNIYTIMVTLVTIYYGINGNIVLTDTFTVKSSLCVFEFIGMCLFSIEGISVSLLIENNMAEPKNFPYVVLGSMPYVCSLMMLIGLFGYWSFGNEAVAPITVHFPWRYWPIMTKVFLGIVIYVTYAQVLYYGFEIQWVYLKNLHKTSSHWYWERIYRTINIILLTLIGCWMPNVCKIMSFLGCFCVTLMCFVFPAIIQLVMNWESPGSDPEPYRLRILRFVIITTFGLTIFLYGTYYNLRDVF